MGLIINDERIKNPHEIALQFFEVDKEVNVSNKELKMGFIFAAFFLLLFKLIFIEYIPTILEVVITLIVLIISVEFTVSILTQFNHHLKQNLRYSLLIFFILSLTLLSLITQVVL